MSIPPPSRPDEPQTAAPLGLTGGGEMGALIRALAWDQTPVGPASEWPQSLRTAMSILLESRFPMYIAWGDQYTQFYNDGYRPILGSTKHPAALGRAAAETFAESWHIIGPMFDGVMAGQAVGSDDWMLPLDRHGFLEECYFTFSYSPIRAENGVVGGVHVTVTETTRRVLHERRLTTLRDLAANAASARAETDAWRGALAALAHNGGDISFALTYTFGMDGEGPSLVGTTLPANASGSGTDSHLSSVETWPLDAVARSLDAVVIEDVRARLGVDIPSSWSEAVETAVVVPIARPGTSTPYGALVVGLSPRLAFDDAYRVFLRLVADHVGLAVTNARAYAEERRRTEALAEIDRAKTAFFSNISHEFRTPLTLMLGPVEYALAHPDLGLTGDSLRTVYRNTLRLLKLVNSLLDFSRLESGRLQASYAPTDLAAVTAELASTFRSAIERAGLRLEVDCPPLDQPVHVDREMWEKIVLNLLSNALKFTFEGTIRVGLHASDSAVVLTIADSGVGIPRDELPRLFERFHRVEHTRSRTHEGSGIGLALVRDLVSLHQGTIDVASELDRGTTFRVTLPVGTAHLPQDRLSPATASTIGGAPVDTFTGEALRWSQRTGDEAAPTTPVPGAAPPTRILLVDDNADLREYVARLLHQQGWTVQAVADGAEALSAVQASPPDLILADVMMPTLDGFGLLAAVRGDPRTATVPLIMLSARAGEESRIEGLTAGADDYLVKPFSAKELVARVATHLQLARLRADAVEAGQRLRELFMESPIAIAVLTGPDHQYELANPGYLEMVHKTSLVGQTIAQAFPEVVGTPLMDLFDRVLATGEPFSTNEYTTALMRDGVLEQCVFKFNLVPVRGAGGAPTGMMCTAVEITDEVRARRSAEGAHRLLATVVEQMPVGIIIAEAPRGKTLLANSSVETLLGYPALQTDSIEQFAQYTAVHPDGRRYQADEYPLVKALRGEAILEEEVIIVPPDGTRRVMLASAAPVYGDQGTLTAAVVSFADITERKEAEAHRLELLAETQRAQAGAEAANRAKDEFLAMLGHELRNPLAPMLTALHLMQMRGTPEVEKERAIIERQAQHLVHLVDDLLDVSRVTRGKIVLKLERANLSEVVAKGIELASPILEQREHALTVDVGGSLVVDGDPARLAQVVSNLVVNAAKYTEQRGQVSISAAIEDGQVVLRVRDTGIGIDPETLPHIFDLFVQERQALDRAQGGLGLGLTIVRSLVSLHGGTVTARSEGRNRGSEFIVRLPLLQRASGSSPQGGAPATRQDETERSGRRVLVVDDNQDAAEMLGDALMTNGHETRVAHDGPQALALAGGFAPEIALLDLGLPVMDGYELARRLRAMPGLAALRLVAVTGYGQQTDRKRSHDAGFDAHLVKPIDLDALTMIIDNLVIE